jgi:hypothetical protein
VLILSCVTKISLPTAILCSFATLLNSPEFSAQTAPTEDQWGERFNTQGAKLAYKELGRTFVSGRTVVTYNLFASGLSKRQHSVLWVLNVGGKPQPTADAYVNEEGKVVNVLADPQRRVPEDPINVKVFGGKGEPIQFALISDDDRFRVFAQIVPFPIEVTSGPCRLSAIQTAPYYLGMFIRVTGLQPNEDLIIDQQSESEGAQTKAKADDQGNYNAVALPAVKGKHSGKARFKVASKSCKIGIEFPWGDGSYKYQ